VDRRPAEGPALNALIDDFDRMRVSAA
jgi:hypothetical protein